MFPSHLEVVWQLRAAGIARVHGDADEAGGLEGDGGPLEDEGVEVSDDRSLDGEDLLGYDRENLGGGRE